MNNIVKKISAFALAFTLIGGVPAAAGSSFTKFDNAIVANAAGYTTDYTYCTAASDLQVRQGPGTNYAVIAKGTYVKTGVNFNVVKVSGSWGYATNLPTNKGKKSGWVCLSYCNYFTKNKNGVRYKVNTQKDPLNVRTGPSTRYAKTGSRNKGAIVYVYAKCNGFAAIDSSCENWVSLSYLKRA